MMDVGPSSCDHPHRPPKGKTLLTIGQDLFSIRNYLDVQYNASLHEFLHHHRGSNENSDGDDRSAPPTVASSLPSTFMLYTDIQTLRGLDTPVDYGSGIEYADGLLELAATTTTRARLQIGLWLNGTQGCRDILEGSLDAQLERLFAYLTSRRRRRTLTYLRVGYEFDNPSFGYDTDPIAYRDAFRYIVQAYHSQEQQQRKDNTIVFVWHSWGAGLRNNNVTLDAFYPGDDVVDWCGVSLFSQFYDDDDDSLSSSLGDRTTVDTVLDFCTVHRKPIMIAESTPFGGIPSLDDPWNDWFQPVLDLISEHGIAMWSYIDCDWEAQPMWHNVGFGDTRLATNRTVLQLWRRHVLQNPRFVQAMDLMDGSTSTPCTTTTTTTSGMDPATVSMFPATTAAIVGSSRHPSQHQQQSSSSSSLVVFLLAAAMTVAAGGWILMVWIRKTLHDGQRTRLLRRLLRQRSEYGTLSSRGLEEEEEEDGDNNASSSWRSSSMDALQYLTRNDDDDDDGVSSRSVQWKH